MNVPNLALAPRRDTCRVCQQVSAIEDVNWRLWNEAGDFLGYGDAIAYCREVGMAGSNDSLRSALATHRRHVEAWVLEGGPSVYTPGLPEVQRLNPPERGPAHWLDITQAGAEVGMESLRLLSMRLGTLADKDLIAVAKLGLGAAAKIGDLEARGRALHQVDAILRLAAGLGGYNGGHQGSSDE